ncbi:MAG: glycosyltransferase family 2 protein, partial [Frankia sp.]|nr:glycosyltransferase family 2 protein [Frankia sp.]
VPTGPAPALPPVPGSAAGGRTNAAAGPWSGLLPAGPAGQLLVLAEPADPGWRATLAGQPLPPVAAWGWAQAFELPAGTSGEVQVRYDHGPHRALVLAGAAAAGLLVLLAVPAWLSSSAGRRSRWLAGAPDDGTAR